MSARPVRVLSFPAFKGRGNNPYTWLLATHLQRLGAAVREYSPARVLAGRYDVWHIHWPERRFERTSAPTALVRAVALLFMAALGRLRGKKLVWTVHNLAAHEGRHPRLARSFFAAFTRLVDGYVAMSASGEAAALGAFPALARARGFRVPHPHYRGEYADEVTREAARERLGLPPSAPVVLYLGHVRPYKNVPGLVAAFRALPDPGAVLLVAGNAAQSWLSRVIRQAAAGDPRVRLRLERVPGEEIQLYLRAADLVALPFLEILNSGSALLALSFDRPVVVPLKGALGELAATVGADWVRTYEGEFTTATLADALAWARETRRPERAPLDALSWDRAAKETLAAYESLLG